MNNLATIEQQEPVYQQYAVVTAVGKDKITLQADGEIFTARRASSCLVEPLPGDLVLVCRQAEGAGFILAVLESSGGSTTCLSVEGDLRLQLSSGKLAIAAQEGIELATAGQIDTVAAGIGLDSMKARVNIHETVFKGTCLQAGIQRLRLVADAAETLVQRLVQRAKKVFRSVEEDEVVRTGRLDVSASKIMSLNGKYTVMTAKEDVKIDAERIHIG